MAVNYKCILAYGLSNEQIDKIKKRRIRMKIVTNNEGGMKIKDLLNNNTEENKNYEELPQNEKAIIFNGYNDKELRSEIKFIRSFVDGGVLAVVTEQSEGWTFKYLVEHLIEEREFYKSQK